MNKKWRWTVLAVLVLLPLAAAVSAYGAGESWFSIRYQAIVRGGIMMVPILLCSVLMIGFAVERFIMMRADKIVPQKFVMEVRSLVSKGEFDKAMDLCLKHKNPASAVFVEALKLNKRPSMSNELIRNTVQDLGARELDGVALRIRPLLIIGNITPLLGLLGTVLGMIKAFNVVASEAGLGRADLLAAGISEALITTAAGLLIAIPSLALYNYFKGILDGRISERMEITLRTFLEDLFERREER
jgi:biopolymer transport protein ExbB